MGINWLANLNTLPLAKMASKRSLDSFGMPPSKRMKVQNSPARNFKDSWKTGNPWLKYDSKSKSMFCDVCVKAQKSNSFTSGCAIMKKESVTKHAASKEHQQAVSATKQSLDMTVARQAALSKSEAAVTAAMVNVYFAAKQNLANSVVPQLNELVIAQGNPHLVDLKTDSHTSYGHSTSIGDFQQAIASVLQDELVEKVNRSGKFSLMFDESTDISVQQNVIIYIRVLESDALGYMDPHTYFLGIDSMSRADALSIYDKVTSILSSKGIDIRNLCGVSTDGAAVMVGHRSGVVKRLKDEVPGVLATHCIAHRLALSCCSGADAIPYLVKVQEILNGIFKYFHYSPKHMAMLETVQSLNPGQSSRFKQVFHTRWLSFEGSVDALVSNFSSLISVFLEENSGKALQMHKSVTTYKFLYVVHFLCDVLKPLSNLSKMYQKKDLDFSEVNPLLCSTVETIEEFRVKGGHRLGQFLAKVPSEPQTDSDGLVTFDFEGHTIRDSCKQRNEAESICRQFLTSVVKGLNQRFSDTHDSIVLTALGNLFNPSLCHSVKAGDIDVVSEYLASVGFEGFKEDLEGFLSFAHALISSGNKSISSSRDMVNLAFKHKDVYPASAEAGARLLVAPVSTVDCERGFSRQNIIKTCLRNSLSVQALDNLMRISVDGPERESFNFKLAFKKWAGQKTRRILGN